MLQRAASNACSWWWASHVRTKQSKWLEQCLQDMEDNVRGMLKLIEEDGDSFAKRAEMYYKRRPELISSVEDAYKGFKVLADRYEMLSKELQKANHTIGTVFPEQVQLLIEDDEDPAPNMPKKPQKPAANAGKIPKVPKAPLEKLKGLIKTSNKKFPVKESSKAKAPIPSKPMAKSAPSKEDALLEIDRSHKEILALQTVKEFMKGSYESGLAKYWEIENQITEMQEKVYRLQDEFDLDVVIEDNEARALMAEAALKSCQQTLAALEEKQQNSTREAREELKKHESARKLLKSIRCDSLKDQPSEEDKTAEAGDELQSSVKVSDLMPESSQNETMWVNGDKGLDLSSMEPLTVSELTEKVDELVNKVVSVETAVSSQTALISTMRTEGDNLHKQIRKLKNEKSTLIGDTNTLMSCVKELEEKLQRFEDLNKNVESQNSNLQTDFAQARTNLNHLSEKVSTVKSDEPDEEVEDIPSSQDKARISSVHKLPEDTKCRKDVETSSGDTCFRISKTREKEKTEEMKDVEEVGVDVQGGSEPSVPQEEYKEPIRRSEKPKVRVSLCDSHEAITGETVEDIEKEILEMLGSEPEEQEKIVLQEYAMVLKSYKEVKKKLRESETKERETQFESTVQIKELKETIGKKDQEIQSLCQKLNLLQVNEDVNKDSAVTSDTSADRNVKPESEITELEGNEDVSTEDVRVYTEDEEDTVELDDITAYSSAVEEKFREDIDVILDENLDFWLRFSTSFNQVQKFKSEVKDLKDEISKLEKKKSSEGCILAQLKSEARSHYKHLREIETELSVWLDQNASLKEELKDRFSAMCSIQDEITKALKEEDNRFSSHQAAKLQGEVLNMKQENSKVRKELQAGIDQSSLLQVEIEMTLKRLSVQFGITNDQPQLQHCLSKNRVPLRNFIFGTRPKKSKQSIFSFMQPNMKFPVVRAGLPMPTSR